MSWTEATFRSFTRGLSPSPYGTIKTMEPLPGWSPRQYLHEYPVTELHNAFDRFDTWVSNREVKNLLSYDYQVRDPRTGQTLHRRMQGLGAHKSPNWDDGTRGMHMTYMSDTIGDGRGVNYYNFVMGHNPHSFSDAEAIGWRNLYFSAMSPWAGQLITGAFGFAMPRAELMAKLGVSSQRVPELSAALFVAQFGRSPQAVERRGNTAVARDSGGQVEVTAMKQGNDLVLSVINNVRSKNGWWGREYYFNGLVAPSPQVTTLVKDQGAKSDDLAVVGDWAVHNLYTGANALIAEGTGIGA